MNHKDFGTKKKRAMKDFTKEDLLLILNVYQQHINDYVDISTQDLDKIYLSVSIEDLKTNGISL